MEHATWTTVWYGWRDADAPTTSRSGDHASQHRHVASLEGRTFRSRRTANRFARQMRKSHPVVEFESSPMTEYEKARDWQDRLSPRWWRAVWIGFGIAGALWIIGAALGSVAWR